MYKFSDDYVTPVVLTEQFRQERIQQNKLNYFMAGRNSSAVDVVYYGNNRFKE